MFLVNLCVCVFLKIHTICGQQADGSAMDGENDALVIETLYFAIHKLHKTIRYCKKGRESYRAHFQLIEPLVLTLCRDGLIRFLRSKKKRLLKF
mgnify:CR=1 FL=1